MNKLLSMASRGGVFAVLVAAALTASGCVAAGWLASGFDDPDRLVDVPAEYLGLEDQRVAVLVDADLGIVFQHPLAQMEVATAISNSIAEHVPGVTVRDATEIMNFQQRNIYWNTSPYADLMERLEVDRLVIVELVDYRLHEPGNVNIWRGLMTANVGITEADATNPNDRVYETTVSVQYPPDSEVGMLNADQRTIRLATLHRFTHATVGKFFDHKQQQRRR